MKRLASYLMTLLLAVTAGCSTETTVDTRGVVDEPQGEVTADPNADLATSESATALQIGASAPTWSDLPGADGQTHSLEDYGAAPILVLAVTCNSCPVAVAYEDRFNEFAREFEDRGVQFVALHVHKSESLEDVQQRATEKDFQFPYLHDESQAVARAYEATVTPHMFVLDQQRNVVYRGAFDDNMSADAVKSHYVKDAVTALLAGDSPAPAVTKQFGCGIKWN